MANYLEPPGQTKEKFLAEKGTVVEAKEMHTLLNDPVNIGICLVNNGMWNAAMIVQDARNANDCTNPNERRERRFYSVPRADLKAIGYTI
jgi:hypothetical protein